MSAKKILIIEDDHEIVMGLGIRLRAAGFTFVVSEDAVIAQTMANREQPDLIILDLGLPGGDGLTVLKRLQSNTTTMLTPVIVLTARDSTQEGPALDAGAIAFFQKPADNDLLMESINDALQTHSLQDPGT